MSLRELLARVWGTLGHGRRDGDLTQELDFHREMLEAQHRARGLDPAAARRAATLDLGGAAQIAEEWRDQRGLPIFEMLWQDVRYGLRMLRRGRDSRRRRSSPWRSASAPTRPSSRLSTPFCCVRSHTRIRIAS